MKNILKTKKRRYIALGVILLIVASVAALELTDTTHLFHKSATVSSPNAPIAKLPKQPLPNDGQKAVTNTNGIDKGSATDKKGQTPTTSVSTDPSMWSKSASGVVTVKSPLKNGSLKSGGTITGSASASEVQYRLIDDEVGVISQGPISVVDGNFTATLNFTAHSKSGRLDVFTTETSGREINEVQIAITL